ncbi:MAG: hypothetical protein OXE52_08780 [Chloroflexi bacterium]|nr:hypothetical protein [Chloroflexota bacterium]
MSSRTVHTAPEFEKEVRKLKRRFPDIAAQVRKLVFRLSNGELPGDRVSRLFIQSYKVRLPNPSTRRGKSGGFRVYYAVYQSDTVYLITIYSKTDKDDVSHYEIQQRIKRIERELSSKSPRVE